MKNDLGAHWRDSSRTPRFFFIDARACIPVLLTILHFKVWTLFLSIVFIIFLAILERFSISLIIFLRIARHFLTTKKKIRLTRLK